MSIVDYLVKDRRAYVTLNRPEKRNALNTEMVMALKIAFEKAATDTDVKVVVLGARGKVFCAGADLAYLQQLQENTFKENLDDSNHLKELFVSIYNFPKPVIASVQGHAIAGGCGLATVCDFVYAVDHAKFGYSEVKIGFVPALVMVFLIRKLGEAKASELLISGQPIAAEEARNIHLVHKVFSEEMLEKGVEELADALVSGNSGEAMKMTKDLLKKVQDMDLKSALDAAARINAQARATDDCKKGIASFLDKDPLSW